MRAALVTIDVNQVSSPARMPAPDISQMSSRGGAGNGTYQYNCQFAEHLYSLERILIRPVEAGCGMSLEHTYGFCRQRLSQPGVERFGQAKIPQELPDDLW